MNPLEQWRTEHIRKVKKIIRENNLTGEQIPQFFLYDNLRERYPDFCPLFEKDKLCHAGVEREKFCCLFCACPFYDHQLWDEENKIFGGCRINSRFGRRNEAGYWDCTNCVFVHNIDWVRAHPQYWENLGG